MHKNLVEILRLHEKYQKEKHESGFKKNAYWDNSDAIKKHIKKLWNDWSAMSNINQQDGEKVLNQLSKDIRFEIK